MTELNVEGLPLGATLLLGLALGLKHSLEADHLLAVGTLVTRAETQGAKGSVRRAARLGALWGLGHTFTLLLVGGAVVLSRSLLSREVPLWVEEWAERVVALMLIALGARALWAAWQWKRGGGHVCVHTHEAPEGEIEHAHFHRYGEHECAAQHERAAQGAAAKNSDEDAGARQDGHEHSHGSFLVGMVHGLAGSAGLMLLVLAAIPHPFWALCFVGVFGAGSVGGMSAVTAIFACSLRASQRLSSALPRAAQVVAGVASLAFGVNLLR